MQISKEEIEAVKEGNDLVTVIRSRNIILKKKGKSLVGLCPFHEEKTPSFTVDPEKQLWNCFGCARTGKGSGGDVIGFVVKYDGVTFREAIDKLNNGGGKKAAKACPEPGRREKKTTNQQSEIDNPKSEIKRPNHQKLLKRIVDFYHTTFTEDIRGLDYLKSRGIEDKSVFADFKVGFANGTLLNALPDDGEVMDSLKQLGILNDKGNEFFYGSVVFPLYDINGGIATLYGRRIDDAGANHLYLPGSICGLFNRQAAKLNKEIILTESVIDALTLISHGFKNTIPCYGVNGFTDDHMELLKKEKVKTVYLCFDADETGKQGAAAVKEKLLSLDMAVHVVKLPDGHDINSFFLLRPGSGQALTANGPAQFKALLAEANPGLKKAVEEAVKEEKESYQETENGFTVTLGGRLYEIIGISRTETKLKATVKGVTEESGDRRRFHVDTVDFYSSRSRSMLAAGLAGLFGEGEVIIADDMNRIMEYAERRIASPDEKAAAKEEMEPMTDSEKEEALRFLKSPAMFDEILDDLETIGYTGDDTNKLLCYIAAVSRKLENPLSVMIQSRSAAGKSYLQDTVLSLIPESDYVKYTRLTDQSLFYKDRTSLANKILAIEELDGMNGAIYSIRAIQSSKKITIAYTGKDAATGSLKTAENTVEGPVMVFITTTQVDIDGETASRFVFISLDESQEMTEKIFAKQRQQHTLGGLMNKLNTQKIKKKHYTANRLLKPLYVINPYSELLTFTSRSLRARRDHTKYLNLILAVAYLFQYQREVKTMDYGGKGIEYITVKLGDIEKANAIAGEVLGISLDELSPPSKKLLTLIREMVTKQCRDKKVTIRECRFNRKAIREYTGWSDFQIRSHIRELEDLEYIWSVTGQRGKEYVYELVYREEAADGHRSLIGQIGMEELKAKAEAAGIPVE